MSKKFQCLVIIPFLLLTLITGIVILAKESVTIKGVPITIILKFLGSEKARNAYLEGDKQELHAQLEAIGIEEDIKAFYRPRIQDESRLDQYIHQIFYENTGYVGDAYYVNFQGVLALKKPVSDEFEQWFRLAYKAGLVTGSKRENGVLYIINAQGKMAPYKEIASIFPIEMLRSLTEIQVER